MHRTDAVCDHGVGDCSDMATSQRPQGSQEPPGTRRQAQTRPPPSRVSCPHLDLELRAPRAGRQYASLPGRGHLLERPRSIVAFTHCRFSPSRTVMASAAPALPAAPLSWLGDEPFPFLAVESAWLRGCPGHVSGLLPAQRASSVLLGARQAGSVLGGDGVVPESHLVTPVCPASRHFIPMSRAQRSQVTPSGWLGDVKSRISLSTRLSPGEHSCTRSP